MKKLAVFCVVAISLFVYGCTNSNDWSLDALTGTGAGIAKYTLLRSGDYTEKRISEYWLDEYVLGADGESERIRNVVTGRTGNLLFIQTNTGRSILIGGDQPIRTVEGFIPIKKIQIGTNVVCGDGVETIVLIYEQHYDDTIYNLAFDGEIAFYANGFLIGDYNMMRRMSNESDVVDNGR